MAVSEQIKRLRRALNLTQQEFADRIGVKRNTVATYEMGRSSPSDAALSLICREFNVSETWLRTGEGEMFAARSREDELAAAVERLMTGEDSEFRRRLVLLLSRLDASQWEQLQRYAWELVEGLSPTEKKVPAVPEHRRSWYEKPVVEWTEQDKAETPKDWDSMTREEKIAEFTRQLDDEEKNAGQDSGPVGSASAG